MLEGLGSGIRSGYGTNPYLPKPAAFAGEFLKSFGESRAAQRSPSRSRGLEEKLGAPLDFFLKLTKEAQNSIMDKAGIGGESYLDQPIPELEGQTYRQAQKGGLKTHGGTSTIPLDLLPDSEKAQYLSRNFPGLADAQNPYQAAQTGHMKNQDAIATGKYPYEIQKLLADIEQSTTSGDANKALAGQRKFGLWQAQQLSEANQVPEVVLEAARNQGFTQLTPGRPITWKEFRAVTHGSAAMNAFADALTQTSSAFIQRSQSGQPIDEQYVNNVADVVSKRLRGFVSTASVTQLKQAIRDQWKAMQGMVTSPTSSPLPYQNQEIVPNQSEDLGGDSPGIYP